MNNRIFVNEPVIEKKKIKYSYDILGPWEKAFLDVRSFEIEYSIDVSEVPSSIAIVPFLANVLPIVWIYDAEITVLDCDYDFFNSIEEIRRGYAGMYPMVNFRGRVISEKITKNLIDNQAGAVAFFSGGVDAYNTLTQHYAEKPTLLTVWGADVKFDDLSGWYKIENHLLKTSNDFQLDFITIKSGLRMFIDEFVLYKEWFPICRDDWWHGFQHGIGIISHAAPIVFVLKKKIVYFASSFTVADKGKVTCASDPTIDNNVHFCGVHVIHDGYEFTRQMKVNNITNFSKDNNKEIALRVCWESAGGSNCCNCEKCWRTILGIYAEGYNPKDFGFEYDKMQLKKLSFKVRYGGSKMFGELRYKPIQVAMRNNTNKKELPKEIRWFYDYNLKYAGKGAWWYVPVRRIKRLANKIFSIIRG